VAPSDSRSVNRYGHGPLVCKFSINVTVPLCLLCAEAGWLILVNAWLRLERAYLKLRLFLRV
jgi:hypothetical protein